MQGSLLVQQLDLSVLRFACKAIGAGLVHRSRGLRRGERFDADDLIVRSQANGEPRQPWCGWAIDDEADPHQVMLDDAA